MKTAFWKTIYTAGHDAVALRESATGWRLDGTAVYLLDDAPAQIRYGLELHQDWSTAAGFFEGFVGTRAVKREIRRDGADWTLDGVAQEAVRGALDLDFGFTPATNYPQLQRMALHVGQSQEITVAWLAVDAQVLQPLPQIYTRVGPCSYDYDSPQGPYRETLEVASDGFVRDYPTLWTMIGSDP